jgi:hypothetical protein
MPFLPLLSCAIGSVIYLFSDAASRATTHLMGALFCVMIWIGVRHLNAAEFGRLAGLFLKGPFRRIIDLQSRLEEFERSLANAGDIDQCWETIQAGCRAFGFSGARLRAQGRVFETAALPSDLNGQWELRVPIAEAQYLNLYRNPEAADTPAVIGRLAGILRNGLQERFGQSFETVPAQADEAPVRSLTAAAR